MRAYVTSRGRTGFVFGGFGTSLVVIGIMVAGAACIELAFGFAVLWLVPVTANGLDRVLLRSERYRLHRAAHPLRWPTTMANSLRSVSDPVLRALGHRTHQLPPAGYYPDPYHPETTRRFWNGRAWTGLVVPIEWSK